MDDHHPHTKFFHLRLYPGSDKPVPGFLRPENARPQFKGGITLCRYTCRGFSSYGYALCSPKDAYCAKRGRQIAKGRARKAWHEEELVLSLKDKHLSERVANALATAWDYITADTLRQAARKMRE